MSSIPSGYTSNRYNKIDALKELRFEFYEAKKIRAVIIIKGAAINIKCIPSKEITLGDHTTFVGEIIEASNNADKAPDLPLPYHAQLRLLYVLFWYMKYMSLTFCNIELQYYDEPGWIVTKYV